MADENTTLFDPIECASLHNRLIQHAVQANPSISPSLNALKAYSEDDPFLTRLSPTIQTFLSLITSWPVQGESTALTPFCQPPTPRSFFQYKSWSQFSPYEDELILLYQDISLKMENQGGLFFDQEREVACWIDPTLGFPPEDSWFPLADILRRWVAMWTVGKIEMRPDIQLGIRAWGEWEVRESLKAWDGLVAAIEERIPTSEGQGRQGSVNTSTTLVESTVAERWCDHPFQRAFLSQARAPRKSGLNIAPGVRAWTTQSFEDVHVNEAHDSERKLAIGTKASDHSTYQSHRSRDLAPALLFPSDAIISKSKPASRSVENFWGRGSILLERKSGLYLYPEEEWGDAVKFVDDSGTDRLFTYRNGWCPWMRSRPLATLREVLAFWTALVEDGVWMVDGDGVVGGVEYFNGLEGEKKIVDLDGVETEIEFCANWDAAPAF